MNNLSEIVICCASILFIGMIPSCSVKTIKTMPYPMASTDSSVVDDYFGTKVPDPYRPLEDDNSKATAAWVKAENEVTDDYISQIPYRDTLRNRVAELMDYRKERCPFKIGDYYFTYINDGLQNQSILYYSKELDGEKKVFLDPNKLSEEGTVAIQNISFSKDHRFCAYSLSKAGSDWAEIRIMEVETLKPFNEILEWVKFSNMTWDENGFYYSRYDKPEGSVLSAKNEFQKIYYHRLGESQEKDRFVYMDSCHPLRYFSFHNSEDNRWEFIYSSEGTYGTEILYRRRDEKSFRTLFKGFDYEYEIIDVIDNNAWILTNKDADNRTIFRINLEKTSEISTIIPESDFLLESASTGGGDLFVTYLKDASSKVFQYSMDGSSSTEIKLPGIGTASGFGCEKDDKEFFYSFSSFTTPSRFYKYDINRRTSSLYKDTKVNFNPDDFIVEEQFYPSKDGTKVHMFIVHKDDIELDGTHPTLLYGYGGFSISETPGFNADLVTLLEQGGVYAVANIRGGNEYGEKWHKGGMLQNKQNVFDDFISAGEFLISEGYTSKEKLAIYGGSNGGLLVGACLVQRPDLFAVCFPAVGVLDMLRYHKFTIGWGWVVEYGSSDNKDQFAYIYKYSPVHNIKNGVHYPATMITTGDHDDRVVPAHSFKFAATLQQAQGGDKPILISIATNAGHGAGKPLSKRIDERANMYAFLFWNTNTPYKY